MPEPQKTENVSQINKMYKPSSAWDDFKSFLKPVMQYTICPYRQCHEILISILFTLWLS